MVMNLITKHLLQITHQQAHADCPGVCVTISVQFAPEMCATDQNSQKKSYKPFLVFKVIQGHCFWCQKKPCVQLLISDYWQH